MLFGGHFVCFHGIRRQQTSEITRFVMQKKYYICLFEKHLLKLKEKKSFLHYRVRP